MKTTLTFLQSVPKLLATTILFFATTISFGQVSLVCTSPTNTIYGMTADGEIYPINTSNAKTGSVVKNGTYPGNNPKSANGLGYNSFNGKFYYFKRNVTSSPQEFVSFNPATNTVSILASSTCTDDVHTGSVSFDGAGYYTIDVEGTLHYYSIATNKWVFITSKIVDQYGNNVTNVIKSQSAGDMAIDGQGNIWFLTSSNSNYGLYKIPGSMPTSPVTQLNVVRVIAPTASTPTGKSFAGIAFNPSGEIYMATKSDDKLYRLQNTSTLVFIGNLDRNDIGNDLTSCSFPVSVLPVTWKHFDVNVKNGKNITLNWEVVEFNNKGFYIQHSLDGNDWQDIAFVVSKNNNETEENYTYSYTNNLNGKQYYRLKQVDMDNKFGFSEVKVIVLKNETPGITIFPNPTADQIRIANLSGNNSFLTNMQVFDLSGKIIMEKKLSGGSVNTINLTNLQAGTYLIRVLDNNGVFYNHKVVKQ